jgi:hypothetical protein
MRIAILGNMNNNGFSLLRYFRDLGINCDLLLFKNDGRNSLNHFRPENDTWEYEKWEKYIKQTKLLNSPMYLLPNALRRIIGFARDKFLHRFNALEALAITDEEIAFELGNYDKYVGSGISPALFENIHSHLQIFFPYSIGVEYSKSHITRSSKGIKSIIYSIVVRYFHGAQERGILHSQHVLNADLGETKKTLDRIGKNSVNLPIPMIYNQEEIKPTKHAYTFGPHTKDLDESYLTFFHHSRLLWKRPTFVSKKNWRYSNKNNDQIFINLKQYLKDVKSAKIRIFVVEYGRDVDSTKKLVKKLGLEEYVTWLPMLSRREILYWLEKVDVAIGEFYSLPKTIWGGTGWEALATGTPLIQKYDYTELEFLTEFGCEPPPILGVNTEVTIYDQIKYCIENKNQLKQIGAESRDWFNKHNGVNLAKQWKRLLG